MPTDESLRIAHHECGHAIAAYMLRGSVRAVSIRPRRAWAGVTAADARAWHPGENERTYVGAPLVLWPARVERRLKGRIIILLAGPAAERLAPVLQPDDYETPAHCEVLAAEQIDLLFSERERSLLTRGDERSPDAARSDETRATETAHLLVRLTRRLARQPPVAAAASDARCTCTKGRASMLTHRGPESSPR
jgi:hypothetical protein